MTTPTLRHLAVMLLLLFMAAPVAGADLSELVAGEVTQAAGEFAFTEGPVWHPDGYLLFSDIPNNRVMRLNADGELSEWLNPSGGANGLVCDAAGNVYACQGEERRVAVFHTSEGGTGELQDVLAGEFEGKPFNKPNDLALDTHGGLYFTDPNYGRDELSQPVEGVYYVAADGQISRVVDNLPRPNGILVSADGTTLYVANINERKIMRYEITGPGEISDGEVLFTGEEEADGRGPDGMALDEHGNIYATYKTVVVIAPDGGLVGRIEVPEKPANCTFGGTDGQTLYVTARTSLYQTPMQVSGMRRTRTVRAQQLVLEVPAHWEEQEPSNRLRLAQFAVPPAEGDDEAGEFVVFPPFGGSDRDNIERWVNQFDAEGREEQKTEGETTQGKYILVDLTGTYQKPVGPPIQRQTEAAPGYRMLSVILKAETGGNYFLKLTGPEKTVEAAATAFRASFGGDAGSESEYELPAQ